MTKAKPMSGIKKGTTMLPVLSATKPISKKPQPPTGVIINIDEALLVNPPSPRSVSEKIVGNIIASNI